MTYSDETYCASKRAIVSATAAYAEAAGAFADSRGLAAAFIAAHHPQLGVERSVCLLDVLELLEREYHPQHGENPAHPYDVVYAAFGRPE